MSAFPLLDRGDVSQAREGPGVVVLDFWQQTCAPCRTLEPRLDQFAGRRGSEFTGYHIDVDTDPDTPAEFGVQSIPTLIVLRDGKELTRLDGLIREQDLDQALDNARSDNNTD